MPNPKIYGSISKSSSLIPGLFTSASTSVQMYLKSKLNEALSEIKISKPAPRWNPKESSTSTSVPGP